LLVTMLPTIPDFPFIRAAMGDAIKQLEKQKAAFSRRRRKFRVQLRKAVALVRVRSPRRRQARARRVRCDKRQADSGGCSDGDGDGPPTEGPSEPLRDRAIGGDAPSLAVLVAPGIAARASSPCQKDAPERGTLQRRHRRQWGAELRGTRDRRDTRFPFQLADAPKALQSEFGSMGVGGQALPSRRVCAQTKRAPEHSVPLHAWGTR
jgi:hypothetical protein